MLEKIMDTQNPFWKFMGKLFDVVILNLLWTFFSIPVVTAGASTTAVYAVCFSQIREQEPSIAKSFIHNWKIGWGRSTGLFFILLGISAVLIFDIVYFLLLQTYLTGIFQYILCAFLTLILCIVWMTGCYAFALHALFDNTLITTIRNALVMTLRHPVRSLSILVINGVILIGGFLSLYWAPMISVLFLLIGIALCIFLNCIILLPVMTPHLSGNVDIDA